MLCSMSYKKLLNALSDRITIYIDLLDLDFPKIKNLREVNFERILAFFCRQNWDYLRSAGKS